MPTAYRYRVTGLRELQRDLRRADAETAKRVRDRLRQVGNIVRDDATDRGGKFAGIGPYRTVVRQRGVTVEQTKGKVTGTRGDFAATQMRSVLEPALDAKEAQLYRELEDAIDDIADMVD